MSNGLAMMLLRGKCVAFRLVTMFVLLAAMVGSYPFVSTAPAQGEEGAEGEEEGVGLLPIVMEQATTLGKVVLLEDAESERGLLIDLNIEVWDEEKEKQLYQTRTDKAGMFKLPELDVGIYVLVVGRLNLKLRVDPRSEERREDRSSKVVFILVPKDVV